MNSFDAVVTAGVILAAGLGFAAGLLRSLATILAYLAAAPIAVAITPHVTPLFLGDAVIPADKAWLPVAAVFVLLGLVLAALFRAAVSAFAGEETDLFDRIAGALLGAVRILLVAVLIVVVFDRVVPRDREPEFLAGSRLRPYLSAAGQRGLQTLPPDVETYLDRLKRERGL
jgi:membrane protein required for colicin V production